RPMIRQLSQCPYCQRCEIALDDHPELVFNPDTPGGAPCEHLVWVDGRFSEWEAAAHGANRVIGSTEFRWDHPTCSAVDPQAQLTDYLKELVNSGKAWDFAPADPFEIQTITAEEKAVDARGKERTVWDVDGWAIFARDAPAFAARLPEYQARQLAALRVEP